MAQVWRSALPCWPSNRATDSTCCLTDLWATYHSPKWRMVTPRLTGLHRPTSHSITKDSAHRSVWRGHVGGRTRVHDPNVPSGGWSRGKHWSQRSCRHCEWLTACETGPFGATKDVAWWRKSFLHSTFLFSRSTQSTSAMDVHAEHTHVQTHMFIFISYY